ncbi:MAG: hypothetical protein PHO53_03930 [Actinomycetota bacterium]|nr:hypothetical protein [Actinomycetota bacterium]
MKTCKSCGFPLKFARYFEWRNDGSILSTDTTGTASRITFLPDGELENIFHGLSQSIGLPVDPFLIEAQKQIGKELLANLPLRYAQLIPSSRFFRPQFAVKLAVRLISSDFASLGDGIVRVEYYRAGKALVLRVKNPCLIPLTVGSASSIYESIENMPSSNIRYGMEGEDLVIWLSPSREKPEREKRLYLEPVTPSKGNLEYKRCQNCNVPFWASETLEWDMKSGIIRNKKTSLREAIVSVQSINAILRELSSELGDEVRDILYEKQKDHEKNSLETQRELKENWEEILLSMAFRGLGYPTSFKSGDNWIEVEIENPYNQELYAGKLAARLETITNGVSTIHWEKERRKYRIETQK